MASFTGAQLDVMDYDLTEPIDYRPDPDRPGLTDEERERRRHVREHGAWKGIIPEPSQDKVRAFFHALQEARLEVAGLEAQAGEERINHRRAAWTDQHPGEDLPSDQDLIAAESIEQVQANVAAMMAEREKWAASQAENVIAAIAEFTDNTPGPDVLGYLPYRVRENFLGWLAGHFSPEAVGAASTL